MLIHVNGDGERKMKVRVFRTQSEINKAVKDTINSEGAKISEDIISDINNFLVPQFRSEILALVLMTLIRKYGFGTKRLARFFRDFLDMIDEVENHYDMHDRGDCIWICVHELKEKYDIDVRLTQNSDYQLKTPFFEGYKI